MNPKFKVKGYLAEHQFSNTSVASISNSLVVDTSVTVVANDHAETSLTEIKVTLVGLDQNLSKKPIPIWFAKTSIELTNGNAGANLKDTLLFDWGANYLLSIARVHDFGMNIKNVGKRQNGKQYINAGDWIVSTNFSKGPG